MEMAGARHVAFVEWNANACNTLRKNYGDDIVHETDVRNFSFSQFNDVDIIAGGPPCQPFSLGGKAKGFDDTRDMFPAAISAIRTLMPKAFIFENVKGILRKSFSEYFEYILLQLKYPSVELKSEKWIENLSTLREIEKSNKCTDLMYNVEYHLVNAADYGVPQKRERVIIVGFRRDMNVTWSFPQPSHSEDALLWEKCVTGQYWQRHNIEKSMSDTQCDAFKHKLIEKYGLFAPDTKPWLTMRDAFKGLNIDNIDKSLWSAKSYPGHTGSNIDEPSKTIKAGAHGVPGGENMIRWADGTLRYLSIAEAKRIQTFPDNYTITGAWTEAMRQIGNAVPVRLAQIISKSVTEALNNITD